MKRTMQLGEMLPRKALIEITQLINSGKRSAADFRPVLARYADELSAKGIDPGYLAYAIEFTVSSKER